MAGDIGIEPMLTDSESVVLPLDESPAHQNSNKAIRVRQAEMIESRFLPSQHSTP